MHWKPYVISLAVGLAMSTQAVAETLEFEGQVEAFQRAELSSRLDGVVAEILFSGGERVETGAPLIVLDKADTELAVAIARAEVKRADAALEHAREEVARGQQLTQRGVATRVQQQAQQLAFRTAEADLAIAQAGLRQARLNLARTEITAPIDGLVSRPGTAVGAFLEAESGAPLGEILRIDPALVAYRVPYGTRMDVMTRTGATTLEQMFERVSLQIVLPGGQPYPHTARPDFASATVDPTDGTLTVWASVINPDAVLRPGMRVSVLSSIQGTTE